MPRGKLCPWFGSSDNPSPSAATIPMAGVPVCPFTPPRAAAPAHARSPDGSPHLRRARDRGRRSWAARGHRRGRDASEAPRRRHLEGVSHAQSHRLRRGRRCRGDQGVGQPRRARLRHHLGRRLALRPGRGGGLRAGGAGGDAAPGALGLPVEPGAGRPRRRAPLRRDEDRADVVRRRQDRLPPAPYAVPDHPQVRRHRAIRRVLRHQAARGRRAVSGRGGGRAGHRAGPGHHREGRHPLHGGLRQDLPLHHQRQHQERRRDGLGLSRGRAAEGHGVRSVPSDRPPLHGDPDHRGGASGGGLAPEQGRLPLPPGLRPGHAHAQARAALDGAGAARPPLAVLREGAGKGSHPRRPLWALRPPRHPPLGGEGHRPEDSLRPRALPQVRGDRSDQGDDPGPAGRALHDGRDSHRHSRSHPDRGSVRGGRGGLCQHQRRQPAGF